jgi:acid stress-induced BolA-like protein IbaG/YrbA
MSKVKVAQTLTRALKLKEPTFRLERWGDQVYGSVISATFRRMDDLRRQRSIWNALEAEFGPKARQQVGMILAYTPQEWDFDASEPPRNAPTTKKTTRRRANGSSKAHAHA